MTLPFVVWTLYIFLLSTSATDSTDKDDDGVTLLKPDQVESLKKNLTIITVPTPANCVIEKKVINLRKHLDILSEVSYPRNTRIERCGGCCSQPELFVCTPTKTDIAYFKIFVRKFLGEGYAPSRIEVVSVVRHLACNCACKRKAKDCSPLQTYKESECACICTNDDDKKKCLVDDSGVRYWNAQKCECTCSNQSDCVTGFSWNKHACSCMPEQTRRTNYAPTTN